MAALKASKPEKVLIGSELYILWRDGHESHLDFFSLRDLCPCAHCVDELTGQKVEHAVPIPRDIRMRSCEYIGNYALRVQWSDGHNTGLYSFKNLRKLCACSSCLTTTTAGDELTLSPSRI